MRAGTFKTWVKLININKITYSEGFAPTIFFLKACDMIDGLDPLT